ncbi:MAG TPA: hypothetical protein VFK05_08370 [Polyangiaceae bacterium]|nr:hypothetical protein [Polyangiaceae bacterium]
MSDAPIITEKDAYEQLGNGLLALAGAMATAGASPLVGAVALAGPTVALLFGRGMHRFAERRLPKFATSFLRAFDATPEEAARKVNAAADQPNFTESLDDVMMRSFRQMMDAVDDEVVSVLGYMAGVYTFERKKPDALFRGLGRVLCDLESRELDQLVRIIRLARLAQREDPEIGLTLDDNGQVVAQAGNTRLYEPKMLPNFARVFRLLKQEGLAENIPGDGASAGAMPRKPDHEIQLDSILTSKISEIIDPMWKPTSIEGYTKIVRESETA